MAGPQVEDAAVWDEWVESAFNEIDTDASGSLDSSELRECDPAQRGRAAKVLLRATQSHAIAAGHPGPGSHKCGVPAGSCARTAAA